MQQPQRKQEDVVLDTKLASLNLRRKAVPKDGACLFRAVSSHVYLCQALSHRVRTECVDYMATHRSHFTPFFVDQECSWDHYLDHMCSEAAWGGSLELQALSALYHRDVVIHHAFEDATHIDNGFGNPMHLAFSGGNHYDVVRPEAYFEAAGECQAVVYDLIRHSLARGGTGGGGGGAPWSSSCSTCSRKRYVNLPMRQWRKRVNALQRSDRSVALALSREGADGAAAAEVGGSGHAVAKPLSQAELQSHDLFPALSSALSSSSPETPATTTASTRTRFVLVPSTSGPRSGGGEEVVLRLPVAPGQCVAFLPGISQHGKGGSFRFGYVDAGAGEGVSANGADVNAADTNAVTPQNTVQAPNPLPYAAALLPKPYPVPPFVPAPVHPPPQQVYMAPFPATEAYVQQAPMGSPYVPHPMSYGGGGGGAPNGPVPFLPAMAAYAVPYTATPHGPMGNHVEASYHVAPYQQRLHYHQHQAMMQQQQPYHHHHHHHHHHQLLQQQGYQRGTH